MSEKKLDVQGSRFAITGTFPDNTQAEMVEVIMAAGGLFSSTVNNETDYLLIGEDATGLAYNTALLLGIPLLDERDFFQACAGEEVWLQTQEEIADADLRSLFGEVRSLLNDAAPSRKVWEELTRLLDLCVPEQLEPLVYYANEHLEQWAQQGQMKGLVGSTYDLGDPRDTAPLPPNRRRGIDDEVRVAPDRWVGEMVRGDFSKKHSLVRALDLSSSGLNGTQVCALLENPHLTRIEHFALPTSKKLTSALTKKLCAPPLLETVRMLRPGNVDALYFSDWFRKHGKTQGALRELDVTGFSWGFLLETLKPPYFQGVTTLRCFNYLHMGWQRESLPRTALEELHITNPFTNKLAQYLEWQGSETRLRDLYIHEWEEHLWSKFLSLDLEFSLDVLAITFAPNVIEQLSQGQLRTFREAVYDSILLERVRVFKIGSLVEMFDLEKLALLFPDLEIQ